MRVGTTIGFLCLAGIARGQFNFSDNFNDGNANGWAFDQGTWGVENFYYKGIGHQVGGRVFNCSVYEAFGETDISVEGIAKTDSGGDDVNKMFVARYQDPNNFMFANFRADSRHDMVIEQVNGSSRSLLTPEGSIQLPPHGQTEWHHCRVDMDDNRVVAYFDGTEVANLTVTNLLARPGVVGVMTFGSGGGDEEMYLDDFYSAYFDYVPLFNPISGPGIITSGNADSIANYDNNELTVRPGAVLIAGQTPLVFTVDGIAELFNPVELRLKVRLASSTTSASIKTDIWNFQTGQFELVDTRQSSLVYQKYEKVFTSNASRFIDQATGAIKVRFRANLTAAVIVYPWTIRFDYLGVTGRM